MNEQATVGEGAKHRADHAAGRRRERDLTRASWATTLVILGCLAAGPLVLSAVFMAMVMGGLDHWARDCATFAFVATALLFVWWRRSAFRPLRVVGPILACAAAVGIIVADRRYPFGVQITFAVYALWATASFVAAFLLAPDPRDPATRHDLEQRRALRLFRRAAAGLPPPKPFRWRGGATSADRRERRMTWVVRLLFGGVAAIAYCLLITDDFLVMTRWGKLASVPGVPGSGPTMGVDVQGLSLLALAVDDPLWAAAAAVLVATPLFFWAWRRFRIPFGAAFGVAISAAGAAAAWRAERATPSVFHEPLMWGTAPILPGTERVTSGGGSWGMLVVAAVVFAAAFILAPSPRRADAAR